MAGPRTGFWEEVDPDPRGCDWTGATRPGGSELAAESALRPQLWGTETENTKEPSISNIINIQSLCNSLH